MFDECKTAEYGGRTLGSSYKNGTEFCEAQNFQVITTNHQCFDFDPTPFSAAFKNTVEPSKFFIFLIFNFLFLF